jgi:hypothetical protein
MERYYHPRTLGAQRLADECVVAQTLRDALDVVLDVLPVIVEIRVPPAGCRRDEDLQSPITWKAAQPRADRARREAFEDQRPFEVFHEYVAESLHLARDRFALLEKLLDSLPSKPDCSAEHDGPEAQEREVHGRVARPESGEYRPPLRNQRCGRGMRRRDRNRRLRHYDGHLPDGDGPPDDRPRSPEARRWNAGVPTRENAVISGLRDDPAAAIDDAEPGLDAAVGSARQALRDRRGVLPWPDRPTDERLGGEIRGRGGQRDSNQEGPGI